MVKKRRRGYNPITGFSDIEYTLKDKEKNEIIAIEIGKETEEQRNKIFEYLIEQIQSL
ncbi:MAG: hypothetical protein K2I42_07605 [Anaeroplasmataceae bacterium]|nr:hypothetical protein [Anaeroplasmataceae bacterium]